MSNDNYNLEQVVEKILFALAFKRKLFGCDCLRDALVLSCNENFTRASFSSELYPRIAKKHNSTAANVEGAIRRCIKDCYDNGNLLKLNKLFNCRIVDETYYPTNGEFISSVCANLRYVLKNGELQETLALLNDISLER